MPVLRSDADPAAAACAAVVGLAEPLVARVFPILVVRSNVPGATVDIDAKPAGNAPVELQLGAGSHRIAVHHERYHDVETSAVVRAGERRFVTVPLEQVPPITARWWFWTGVGVIVIGGVALTAALLTDRSPSKGDIPPGEVAAPIVRF